MITINNLYIGVDIAYTLESVNAQHKNSEGIALNENTCIRTKGVGEKLDHRLRRAYQSLLEMIEQNVRELCDDTFFVPEGEKKKKIAIYRISFQDGYGVSVSGISPEGHGFRASALFVYDTLDFTDLFNEDPIAVSLKVRDNHTGKEETGFTRV